MSKLSPFILCTILVLLAALPARAEDGAHQALQVCLKKAADLPDVALAEAQNWLKHGGGGAALLCRATAQFHRGEFVKSGEDFAALAAAQKDDKRGALLHVQAGAAYMGAGDFAKSESEYDRALQMESQDPDIWVGRATERAAAQNYWDAVDDLNKALAIMPDMAEAVHLRGQVWFKLGMDGNAAADFKHAAEIQAEEDVTSAQAHRNTTAVKTSAQGSIKSLRRQPDVVMNGVPQ